MQEDKVLPVCFYIKGAIMKQNLLLLCLLTITLVCKVNANLTYEQYQNINNGTIFYKDLNGAMIEGITLDTKVTMNITGIINRVKISQIFKNKEDFWTEGKYLFPLPTNASVDSLKMRIGDSIIEGEIQLKEVAQKIYESAKQEGKKATLVEQERPNLFTAKVSNIPPKGEIEVIIEYQQKVKYDNKRYSVLLPLVAAQRYFPSTTKVTGMLINPKDLNLMQTVEDPNNPISRPVNIEISLDAGFEVEKIESPYHTIKHTKNDQSYTISLIDSIEADKEFELVWFAKQTKEIQTTLYTQNKDEKEFGLLLVTPPNKIYLENQKKVKREVVFVVDKSGSMGGTSIVQAKQALQLAIQRLNPQDKFNIITYSDNYNTLFLKSQHAVKLSLALAEDFVNNIEAEGGTEALEAIEYGLTSVSDDSGEYLRQVIFITDGELSNEQEIFQAIQKNLGNSKLFAISIGSAPNRFFLEKAASYGKGTHISIGNLFEVTDKMVEFFNKIENPSLSDIKIDGIDLQISDLYYGESIYYSFVAKSLPKEINLSGNINGKPYSKRLKLEEKTEASGIDKLWAKDNIEKLMQLYYVSNLTGQETIQTYVEKLALTHHLVSQFTSLVAVDKTPARDKKQILKLQQVQTKIPQGWTLYNAKIPQTATDSLFLMMIGTLFFSLGAMLLIYKRYLS